MQSAGFGIVGFIPVPSACVEDFRPWHFPKRCGGVRLSDHFEASVQRTVVLIEHFLGADVVLKAIKKTRAVISVVDLELGAEIPFAFRHVVIDVSVYVIERKLRSCPVVVVVVNSGVVILFWCAVATALRIEVPLVFRYVFLTGFTPVKVIDATLTDSAVVANVVGVGFPFPVTTIGALHPLVPTVISDVVHDTSYFARFLVCVIVDPLCLEGQVVHSVEEVFLVLYGDVAGEGLKIRPVRFLFRYVELE